MTTERSGSGDVDHSLALLWEIDQRPTRGPKPGLTLDRIVSTAIAVADAEGLAAVSMRRLGTELGVGTMSLYRYVPGKAELVDLMLDAVNEGPDDHSAMRPAAGGRRSTSLPTRSGICAWRIPGSFTSTRRARSSVRERWRGSRH